MSCPCSASIKGVTPDKNWKHKMIPARAPKPVVGDFGQCPHCDMELEDEKYYSDNGAGPFKCDDCHSEFCFDVSVTDDEPQIWTVPIRTTGDIKFMDFLVDGKLIPPEWPEFERRIRSHFITCDCDCFKK